MRWRNSRDYRIWRAQIIRRDKVCAVCRSNKKRNAHHINHASYFLDQRFIPENGICLCYDCHKSFHIDYCRGFRKKCIRGDLDRFMKIANLNKKDIT